MNTMFLHGIEDAEGTGPYAERIRKARETGMPIPQIWHLLKNRPEVTDPLMQLTQAVMRGEQSTLQVSLRELIAAFTSRRNECRFCAGSHAAVAAELYGDASLVHAVLDDYETAPITEHARALFRLINKVTTARSKLHEDDYEEARRAGWSDQELMDALTIVSLFQYYNCWIDSTGVRDMTDEGYAMSGKRMAVHGYKQS